jgi:hypothetical protein
MPAVVFCDNFWGVAAVDGFEEHEGCGAAQSKTTQLKTDGLIEILRQICCHCSEQIGGKTDANDGV